MSFRRPARSLALGLGALAGALVLHDAAAADPFFDDIPIVLTASRMAQSPVDAPVAVSIIDREMIEASGFTEIHDLLRLVPGFLVADWADGSPTVANHGVGDAYDRRIKVMIDGRTVNSPLFGNTAWQDLPLRVDDIERFEVVRGPNGAAYGANAFQAVINLITRPPSTERGAALMSRIGRDGFHDHGFRLNGSAEGAIDWRLSGSHRRAVNFRPFLNDNGALNGRETIARSVLNLGVETQLNTRDALELLVGLSEGGSERGIPGDLAEPEREDDTRSRFLHLAWRRSFAADSEFSVQYYHQDERVRAEWLNATYAPLVIPVELDGDSRRDDLELQYSASLSPAWRLLLGAGVRREAARVPSMFNTGSTLSGTSSQVFGSVVWSPLARLKVDLGGTLEDHHYSGSLFSPRVAFNYALSHESALRLSAGVSYRTPSLVESRAEQVVRIGSEIKQLQLRAGEDMQPERVKHLELGYAAMYRELGLGVDVRVFHKRYDDYIDDQRCFYPSQPWEEPGSPADRMCPPPPPGFAPYEYDFQVARRPRSYLFQNAGTFSMSGGEFSVDWRRPGWGRVVLSQAVIDIDADEDILDRDFETSAPRSITSLLLIKDLSPRWRASLGYYHHAGMNWLNDGDRVPADGRLDLKLARTFGPAGSDNELAIVAQSVNGRYADFHEGRYRHEPALFASLRLGW